MVFTSVNFILFFAAVIVLYFSAPLKWRWLVLLVASYFFYINIKPVFAILLAAVTASTYVFTRLMDQTRKESRKNVYKVINIILVLLPLFFFKYFAVINNSLIAGLQGWGIHWPLPEIELFLPVGISFYTFMAIGYTIDVFNEETPAEKHPGIVALFISFFPLILSGPIERAGNMLPQFRNPVNPDYDKVVKGLRFMLWGFFMKLVVADRIGIYVDAVYHNIPNHNGTTLLAAFFLYPFQVYADLGGYSLVAIGVAGILGIKVMDNFRRPFFAATMAEFWRRWHMSLITWLTDYVYTPISFALRQYKLWGIVYSLMITFMISGIWHAASLTFVAWGLLQGIYLSVEALTNKQRANMEKKYKLANRGWYIFLSCLITFILFGISQVFARSANLQDAFQVLGKIVTEPGALFIGAPSILIFSILGISMVMLKDFTDEYYPGRFLLFENRNKPVRVMAYSLVIVLILLIGVFDGGEFIYFQF
ncbi:MAG TPA: MBOAT family O-acyltransferase [Chitinophagaceae bacterium]|nr:MBOAT family O-acyltransferase [Chitinophagaceae bacterium]HPH30255.1 MBOAT family O-acyltransferase [Chitinophagaceae bacterium]HPN58219.1 MBOAT family O-acyltransferase [Chitinophagaceae bacterium]